MTNLVEVNNEQVVTTSIMVAESFGKRHDHVLQDIKNLTTENSGVKNMFEKTTYTNSRNREYPMYLINRDGFTLLAMGFTGKEALQFKLQYINAFNQMEEYIKDENKNKIHSYMIEDPIARAEQWIVEQKNKIALEQKVAEYQPKVQYYDEVLQSDNLMTVTQIAKEFGMYAKQLNLILHKKKIQFKNNGQWLLYSQYQDKGYTKSVTSLDPFGKTGSTEGALHVYTKWTQKGREFIHNTLAKDGIYPQ